MGARGSAVAEPRVTEIEPLRGSSCALFNPGVPPLATELEPLRGSYTLKTVSLNPQLLY